MRIMTLQGLGQDDCSRFVAEAQQVIQAAPMSAASLVVNAKRDPLKAEQDLEAWKTLRVYILGVAAKLSVCGEDDLSQQVREAVEMVDLSADKARRKIPKEGATAAGGAVPVWAWAVGAGVVSLGAVLLLKRRGGLSGCGCER